MFVLAPTTVYGIAEPPTVKAIESIVGLRAKTTQHVVEEVGEVDGHHQALLAFPCDWRELTPDGTVRGEAINRQVSLLQLESMCLE